MPVGVEKPAASGKGRSFVKTCAAKAKAEELKRKWGIRAVG